MKVKEYLQNKKPSDQVTFVVVKAEKDEHSPFTITHTLPHQLCMCRIWQTVKSMTTLS
jgi:hypothetical protein